MTERFIVSRRRSGFGDSLWSLAPAWRYAQLTKRTLVIDWRGSCYLDAPFTNAFSLFFEPNRAIDGVPVISDDSVNQLSLPGPFFPSWWNKAVIDTVYRPDEQIFLERDQLQELFRSQQDIDAKTIICDACLMFLGDAESEKQVFHSLQLKDEIKARIESVYREYFHGYSVIGVHVRHGNGEDLLGLTPYWADPDDALQQVCATIERAKSLPHEHPVRVFLCTDSAKVLDAVSAKFPDLFILPKQFRADQAGPLHRPALGIDGARMALVEMYLLARCNTVIRFPVKSAFSRYARLSAPRTVPVEPSGFTWSKFSRIFR